MQAVVNGGQTRISAKTLRPYAIKASYHIHSINCLNLREYQCVKAGLILRELRALYDCTLVYWRVLKRSYQLSGRCIYILRIIILHFQFFQINNIVILQPIDAFFVQVDGVDELSLGFLQQIRIICMIV